MFCGRCRGRYPSSSFDLVLFFREGGIGYIQIGGNNASDNTFSVLTSSITYRVVQKNSCMFESSRPLSAHWPRQPTHSPSALTEHVSLSLAEFFFCSTLYMISGWELVRLRAGLQGAGRERRLRGARVRVRPWGWRQERLFFESNSLPIHFLTT